MDERNFPGYFIPPISLGFSVGSSSHVEHNHSRLGAHTKRKLHAMREQYVCTAHTHTHADSAECEKYESNYALLCVLI